MADAGLVKIATDLNDGEWVFDYALNCIEAGSNAKIRSLFRRQCMKYWLEGGGRWYSASGIVEGKARKWCLLPVYHPSRYQKFDPQYQRTIRALEKMLSSCS